MPVLKTLVESSTKERFHRMAHVRGLSESELLRTVILAVTEENDPSEPSGFINVEKTDTVRLTVRMPRFLMESASSMAKKKGMATSRWITALVQSNLARPPVMSDAELEGLLAANRELSAIGRNINQIARALNEAFHETDRLKLEHLGQIREIISNHKAAIRTLVRASQNAWEAEDGAD